MTKRDLWIMWGLGVVVGVSSTLYTMQIKAILQDAPSWYERADRTPFWSKKK